MTSIASLDPLSPDAAPVPAPTSSVGKELLAGTVAGWAQVFVGQPFDIVKVRLQAGTVQYAGALDCAKQILKTDGFTGYYKGKPKLEPGRHFPLQFACLQAGKRFFVSRNTASGQSHPETLTPVQYYLAGAFAGIGNSVASGPVEHIRIRLQTQQDGRYSGPVDAIKKIYRSDGFRGVYQGQGATLAREAHGYGVYFAVYELLVANEIKSKGLRNRDELNLGKSAMFGAAAGWGMWLLNYPLDVLKSRLQTDSFPSSNARNYPRGMRDAVPALYKEGGAGAFFRGLTPTMISSITSIGLLRFSTLVLVPSLVASVALALPLDHSNSLVVKRQGDSNEAATAPGSDSSSSPPDSTPVTIDVQPTPADDDASPSAGSDVDDSSSSPDATSEPVDSTPANDYADPSTTYSTLPVDATTEYYPVDDGGYYSPQAGSGGGGGEDGYYSPQAQGDDEYYYPSASPGGGYYAPQPESNYYYPESGAGGYYPPPSQASAPQGYYYPEESATRPPADYYGGGGGGYAPQGSSYAPPTNDVAATSGGGGASNQDAANTLADLIASSLGGVTAANGQ
ncbi:hypothetical protein JCM11491_005288 [Sporobolomyces phaffii]